jgi:N-acetylmuramic acid 6-phosphate etherase
MPRAVTRRAPASPDAPLRWARLLTESRNPRSLHLDRLSTERVVTLLLDEDRLAIVETKKRARAIAAAAKLVADAFASGGTIVFIGAGTSGRLGVLEAAECPPTFGTKPDRIVGVMAGGRDSVFLAKEGAEDDGPAGARAVGSVQRRDVVIGVSASSVTPFVREALARARRLRAKTVLVTCAPQPNLSRLADVVVAIRTGPEVLTGSTRLKAGSATKAALNAITTAAMVRVGKAYENLMVDLRQTSRKLQDRARRIVAIVVNQGRRSGEAPIGLVEADRLIRSANDEVKTAIVMGRLGCDADAARRAIAAAGGHTRIALARARR